MNAIYRTFVILGAALAAMFSMSQPLHAQMTEWHGSNASGITTILRRDSAGRWTESVGGTATPAVYVFNEYSTSANSVTLHDPSRNLFVGLTGSEMFVWEGRWTSIYNGYWVGKSADNYRVHFRHMHIWDDKEGGNGDWRLNVSVGGASERTLITKMEGGTGANLPIRTAGIAVSGPTFPVSARVFEHDGGIGAKWEFVGHHQTTIRASGDYDFTFNSSEGNVTVYFTVMAVD